MGKYKKCADKGMVARKLKKDGVTHLDVVICPACEDEERKAETENYQVVKVKFSNEFLSKYSETPAIFLNEMLNENIELINENFRLRGYMWYISTVCKLVANTLETTKLPLKEISEILKEAVDWVCEESKNNEQKL